MVIGAVRALVAVVVTVVSVDDVETSSGSVVVDGVVVKDKAGGEGDVRGVFDVSSASCSVQIRRETAHRWICRLERITIAVVLLPVLVVIKRRLSAEGVRFVNRFFA